MSFNSIEFWGMLSFLKHIMMRVVPFVKSTFIFNSTIYPIFFVKVIEWIKWCFSDQQSLILLFLNLTCTWWMLFQLKHNFVVYNPQICQNVEVNKYQKADVRKWKFHEWWNYDRPNVMSVFNLKVFGGILKWFKTVKTIKKKMHARLSVRLHLFFKITFIPCCRRVKIIKCINQLFLLHLRNGGSRIFPWRGR